MEDGGGMAETVESWEVMARGDPITSEEATKYRSVIALLNFAAPDRPEILYAAKEVLRASSAPGARDVQRLKRVLRYRIGAPRQVIKLPWPDAAVSKDPMSTAIDCGVIEVYVNSDFAGCQATRKSTCGGCISLQGGLTKACSKTLPTLALSTGVAELRAVVRGAAEAEGILSILCDFGMRAQPVMKSDASAAVGIVKLRGLGKVRHLGCRLVGATEGTEG